MDQKFKVEEMMKIQNNLEVPGIHDRSLTPAQIRFIYQIHRTQIVEVHHKKFH